MLTGQSIAWLIAISLWLTLGFCVQALVCWSQWRYLAGLLNAPDRTADPAAVAYGQRRALFQGLAYGEHILRIVIWLYTGVLLLLYAPFATAELGGAVGFVALFMLIDQLLRQVLPWARWKWMDRACGISRLGARDRLTDSLRQVALQTTIATAGALWVLWPLTVAASPWCWFLSTLCLVSGAGALLWGRPHLIEPLFNRFTALPDGELRTRLQAMMERCGTQLEQVWIVDSSRRSKLANAYFAGLGRRKRIVLFDTLIKQLPPAELEAVMAHELGHYACGHMRRYYAIQGGLLGVGFLGFGLLQPIVAPATSVYLWAVAAYVLLPALAWPLHPWFAWLRRRYEYEADAYAAHHAEREALVSALERLLKNNLGAPTMARGYMLFFATHPPADKRLLLLRT